jgi:hypothetical protein
MAAQRRALVFHINGSDADLHLLDTFLNTRQNGSLTELRIVTFMFLCFGKNYLRVSKHFGHIHLLAGRIERTGRENKLVHSFGYKTSSC